MICSELTPNHNELALKSSYQLVADFYTTPTAGHNIMKHTVKPPDGTGNSPSCKQERNSVRMLPGRELIGTGSREDVFGAAADERMQAFIQGEMVGRRE
ncbi:MAG: hypothetical protein C5S45_07940 [Candidatus Methanocomedens sp.]|nr:MAG: hypothetical protein C5S45_07940 [ANME-2 cluster archaeon]